MLIERPFTQERFLSLKNEPSLSHAVTSFCKALPPEVHIQVPSACTIMAEYDLWVNEVPESPSYFAELAAGLVSPLNDISQGEAALYFQVLLHGAAAKSLRLRAFEAVKTYGQEGLEDLAMTSALQIMEELQDFKDIMESAPAEVQEALEPLIKEVHEDCRCVLNHSQFAPSMSTQERIQS